jgi:hypothetical protein
LRIGGILYQVTGHLTRTLDLSSSAGWLVR